MMASNHWIGLTKGKTKSYSDDRYSDATFIAGVTFAPTILASKESVEPQIEASRVHFCGKLNALSMGLLTLVGFAAGTLTTLSFVPQVHKAWRTRRCDDLSLTMLLTFGLGVLLWLIYGVWLRAAPIIVANAVTLALILALIALKLRFEQR